MQSWLHQLCYAILFCGFLNLPASADEPVDYLRDVKPLLKERCYACHGGLKQEADLRLDTGKLIAQGGDSGSAIDIKEIEASLLLARVSEPDESLRMPPEGDPLSAEQINRLRLWIAAGANSPEGEQPQADPREHWAFQQPVRPVVPKIAGKESLNPIDAFLFATQQAKGITPQQSASKEILLRRVHLDLVGLPPTPEELHVFLSDESPDAFERAVAKLLESPRYGERWARHWMDIWRYSDWYGRRYVPDVWNSASQIWRWRDWIVHSLNNDHGYDRMLREMLAADEIVPADYEAGYATGYLIRNWYALNPNDWMRNTVEHTGKAFLGLTFNCAHCHDHKYDPIAHDDYFKFRAFFEPIYVRQDQVPGEADPGPFQDYNYSTLRKVERLGSVRIFDKEPSATTWFYTGGDERNRVEERGSIPPGVPEILSDWLPKIEPVELPITAWYPGYRPEIQNYLLTEASQAITQAEQELATAKEKSIAPAPELKQHLAQAELKYQTLQQEAAQNGIPGALVGAQSLYLDATTGRRLVQNRVQQLEALPEGTIFEFQLRLLTDTYFNFQFSRHADQGLTAGYIGFKAGQILSYSPGGFNEFEAGKYNFAEGQTRFHLRLELQPSQDQYLLTIRSLADEQILVEALPVALNGWNPAGDPTKAIMFDAQAGSRVLVDEVTLSAPLAENSVPQVQLKFDFESPTYPVDEDLIGIAGWENSSYSQGPATSVVSANAGNDTLQAAWREVEAAQRAVRKPQLALLAAEAKLLAAQQNQAALQSRRAADVARYEESSGVDVPALAKTASLEERQAALSEAQADVLSQEHAVALLEAKPTEEPEREKQLTAARKLLTDAQTKLATAKTALANSSLAETYTPFSATYPKTSTGRRKALAEWITNSQNPLTARVAVNHVWLRHFHVPLVESVYDFGLNGTKPSHPELLDWLAVEFMESGWSMKHLHQLIVTSDAYQRSSSTLGADTQKSLDPENLLLWRMNTGRMEAELIRDSLLYSAGKLDFTMGGQEIETKDSLTTFRRSLYYSTYPEEGGMSPLGELFDGPDAQECYRRTRTVIPQQALALTNSDLVHTLATEILAQWKSQSETAHVSDNEQFLNAMFEKILSRKPTGPERELCLSVLSGDPAEQSDAADIDKRRTSLIRAIFNHNDFIAIR